MHYVNQFLASIELYVDGAELSLVLYLSEATAMVSTGGTDRRRKLPPPTKVIGIHKGQLADQFSQGDYPFSPWNELTVR